MYNVLAGGLAETFETTVIVMGVERIYGELLEQAGIRVERLGMKGSTPSVASIQKLRRLVRELQPDVIQGWMYHGNLAASVARWLAPGQPAVAWNVRHTLYELREEKVLTRQVIRANRWLSRRPEAILYNSQVSRRLHVQFGFSDSRGKVIPNGFDTDEWSPNAEAGAEVRKSYGLSEDNVVIGHVARYHPMKDHVSFLQAAVRMASEMPNAFFLLVGRAVDLDDGPLAGIVPTNVRDRFVVVGECLDVARLMQAMDVFCMSSAWGDAFPNVLGEAMACGVPCVTTDVGDAANIVGDTGAVVPPGDTDALYEALRTVAAKSKVERNKLGAAARRRVQEEYSLPSVVEEYRQTYQALMSDKR
jgi:glycosyltransferase involved in cell wall biosynthesis